ncbi:hypothetical protein NHX12_009739 [Muraenolepis orangiensis]|uniref:Uncharacterized protein n=1 Tax=Muraenolepis orangiensis TaxID=630683 RepID=A0A9Q0DHR9_9TELE|nr:hypothetical protein NHX12_009739 [Muraenolepis orangiensis]
MSCGPAGRPLKGSAERGAPGWRSHWAEGEAMARERENERGGLVLVNGVKHFSLSLLLPQEVGTAGSGLPGHAQYVHVAFPPVLCVFCVLETRRRSEVTHVFMCPKHSGPVRWFPK